MRSFKRRMSVAGWALKCLSFAVVAGYQNPRTFPLFQLLQPLAGLGVPAVAAALDQLAAPLGIHAAVEEQVALASAAVGRTCLASTLELHHGPDGIVGDRVQVSQVCAPA